MRESIPSLCANVDFATFVPGVSLLSLVLVFPGFGEREVDRLYSMVVASVGGYGGKRKGRQQVYLPPFREPGKIRREKQKRETPGTKDANTKIAAKFGRGRQTSRQAKRILSPATTVSSRVCVYIVFVRV